MPCSGKNIGRRCVSFILKQEACWVVVGFLKYLIWQESSHHTPEIILHCYDFVCGFFFFQNWSNVLNFNQNHQSFKKCPYNLKFLGFLFFNDVKSCFFCTAKLCCQTTRSISKASSKYLWKAYHVPGLLLVARDVNIPCREHTSSLLTRWGGERGSIGVEADYKWVKMYN